MIVSVHPPSALDTNKMLTIIEPLDANKCFMKPKIDDEDGECHQSVNSTNGIRAT